MARLPDRAATSQLMELKSAARGHLQRRGEASWQPAKSSTAGRWTDRSQQRTRRRGPAAASDRLLKTRSRLKKAKIAVAAKMEDPSSAGFGIYEAGEKERVGKSRWTPSAVTSKGMRPVRFRREAVSLVKKLMIRRRRQGRSSGGDRVSQHLQLEHDPGPRIPVLRNHALANTRLHARFDKIGSRPAVNLCGKNFRLQLKRQGYS